MVTVLINKIVLYAWKFITLILVIFTVPESPAKTTDTLIFFFLTVFYLIYLQSMLVHVHQVTFMKDIIYWNGIKDVNVFHIKNV